MEERAAALDARLADPATYQDGDGDEIAALRTEVEAAREEAERLTARWEELETRREASGG